MDEQTAKIISRMQGEIDRLKPIEIPTTTNRGWISMGLSATYVSATSLTVTGDYTAYFKIGVKVRLTNSTVKYGYVLSSSYSAPNTTVNFVPNTSFSLANAAITNVVFSYAEPPDFPGWFNYDGGLYGSSGSAGTYAEDTTKIIEKFSISGRRCFLRVQRQVTNKGSWGGDVYMKIPILAIVASLGTFEHDFGWWVNNGTVGTPIAMGRWISWDLYLSFNKSGGGIFGWADMTVNDKLLLNTSYEI